MALKAAGTLLSSLLLLQLLSPGACLISLHDKLLHNCVYTIKVVSAPVKGSENTTKVGITFYSSHDQEVSFAAIPTLHEPECYNTDEFYYTATPCLPDICKMRVHFDKSATDMITPRVFLTSVEVGTVLFGEGKRRFDINGWLASDEPPFLVDRTFDLCSWTRSAKTTAATTTTMTTTGTTKCTTNTTLEGFTSTTSSACSTTLTIEP